MIREAAQRVLYRARQEELERDVGLLVAPSPGSEEDAGFLRAAAAVARIEDPRILPIYDIGTADGAAYVSERLVVAPTLAELQRDRSLSPERVVHIGGQLAPALEALERVGLGVSVLPPTAVLVTGEDAYLAPLEAELGGGGDSSTAAAALADLLGTALSTTSGEEGIPRELMDALRRPYSSPSALMHAVTATLPRPSHTARRAAFAAAVVLVAAVVAVAVVLIVSGERSTTPASAPPDAPAGRIVARIPLGGSPSGALAAGGWVWVGTREGKLLRVDPRTRQLIGAPVQIEQEINDLAAGGNSLYVASLTRVTRVNATTGRVSGHTRMKPQPVALALAGHSLWVTRTSTKGHFASYDVVRLDAETLEPLARPIVLQHGVGSDIAARGDTAWVTDLLLGTITRVNTRTGTQRSIQAGSQPTAPVFVGNQLWFADGELQTVTPLDTTNFRLPDRVIRLAGRPANLTVAPGTIWATSTDAVVGPGHLYRIDPAAHKILGRPVQLGPGISTAISSLAVADGALWIPSYGRHALLEVLPQSPLPGPRAVAARPSVLTPGPVPAGRWTARQFVVPFAFSLNDPGWLFAGDAINQRRIVTLEVVDEPGSSISVEAPRIVFGAAGKAIPIRDPIQFIHTLQTNENLRLGPLSPTTLAGTPALMLTARVRPSPHLAEFCLLEACAPVWGTGNATSILVASQSDRIAVLKRNGQTLVIDVTSPLHGLHQRQLTMVLDSLQFLDHG